MRDIKVFILEIGSCFYNLTVLFRLKCI